MTKLAAMPIYGKNPSKISRTSGSIAVKLCIIVCSIGDLGPLYFIQIMTMGWPWPVLRPGQIWKNADTNDFMESLEDLA